MKKPQIRLSLHNNLEHPGGLVPTSGLVLNAEGAFVGFAHGFVKFKEPSLPKGRRKDDGRRIGVALARQMLELHKYKIGEANNEIAKRFNYSGE